MPSHKPGGTASLLGKKPLFIVILSDEKDLLSAKCQEL
jgi:hypothetical protein